MSSFLYLCARFLGKILFKTLFRMEVKGKENLVDIGRISIISSNHESYLDSLILGLIFPRRLRYFSKKEMFSIPVLSFLIRQFGAIPIDRDESSSITMRQGVRVIRDGDWLVIFPEGTRSKTRELLAPKEGLGFLHYKTGAPIIPVYISGAGRALPVGAKFIRFTKIKVFIGEKISIGGKDYKYTAEKVMEAIKGLKER